MLNFIKKFWTQNKHRRHFVIAASLFVTQIYLFAFLITREALNWFVVGSLSILALGILISAGATANLWVTLTERRSWLPME